jgi:lipoprotein-anchoring transpeptidase ErfK/SrfK
MIIPHRSLGWPDAFALSARSKVFQEFEGGPGQIAIHGTYGIGGTPGRAESHGCIRATSTALKWMIRRFGTGTPVDIR